jgi:3-oxoacyl-[acyl-carrier-protein] synthase III
MPHAFSGILATGAYLPERVLTNDELATKVDTSDAWITKRAGIKSRRIIADDQTPLDMAEAAAREALKQADISIDTVDMIIVATASHDRFFPS